MQRDGGFTLLEALVALTVLALMASSLIGASTDHVRRISEIEEHAFAGLIAEARLAEIQLDPVRRADLPTTVTSAGRDWRVKVEAAPTDEPDLVRVTVSVTAESPAGRTIQRIAFADLGASR